MHLSGLKPVASNATDEVHCEAIKKTNISFNFSAAFIGTAIIWIDNENKNGILNMSQRKLELHSPME